MTRPILAVSLSSFVACAGAPVSTTQRPDCPVVMTEPQAGPDVVWHEVEFEVDAPREAFVEAFLHAPLERFIKGTEALPGVRTTEATTSRVFPEVGSVRRVHLVDGTTACEGVLTQDEGTLRYLVTDYTSPKASPLQWGLGAFRFTADGQRTRVQWRYTFRLRGDRLPGALGAPGRALFKAFFVDRDYAPFMDAQVREIQAFAREVAS